MRSGKGANVITDAHVSKMSRIRNFLGTRLICMTPILYGMCIHVLLYGTSTLVCWNHMKLLRLLLPIKGFFKFCALLLVLDFFRTLFGFLLKFCEVLLNLFRSIAVSRLPSC